MLSITTPQALEIAMQHHQAGRLAEAEALYRRILVAEPRHAEALHLLGVIAHGTGHLDAAIELMRQAIDAAPGTALYHNNLANALKDRGDFDGASQAYRRAIELRPDLAMAHNNLGNLLHDLGQHEAAIVSYRRAIALQPDFAAAFNNLGNSLQATSRFEEAVNAWREAVRLEQGYAMAHNNLGNALQVRQELDAAIASFRRAIELQPDFSLAYSNLGGALLKQGQLGEAVAALERAVQLQPDSVLAHNNLATALQNQGRVEEAIACFDRALQLQPDSAIIHSNRLAILHYRPGITPAMLLEAHREYDRRHAAALSSANPPLPQPAEPSRKLRLGFVSPHFARHAVGHFLIRLLENLDPREFEIICYSDTPAPDATTRRIQSASAVWRESSTLSDRELAAQIREDAVDILFDLAGHTSGHRLLAFARKPAPVQITWLDYVGTTGLRAMDYLLADPRQVPSEAEPWVREKVLRMPDDYICYDPLASAPEVGPLPAIAAGHVTFGSFNLLTKTHPGVIGVWARILHRVPRSRLLLKARALADRATASRVHGLFAAEGIPPERVEFLGWSPPDDVLACYPRLDLALDTFPYNGGLTTCEALWMGVPVVTCPGETFAGRHGLAHLTAAGLTETIARTFDEYVDIAATLASDLPRLAALRAGLREKVAASPLCDGKRFAGHFAALMRNVWRDRPLNSAAADGPR